MMRTALVYRWFAVRENSEQIRKRLQEAVAIRFVARCATAEAPLVVAEFHWGPGPVWPTPRHIVALTIVCSALSLLHSAGGIAGSIHKEEGMRGHWTLTLGLVAGAAVSLWVTVPVHSQSEQAVEVVIKNSTFVTKQTVLRLGSPTTITIRNEDSQRHDFGSTMFEGIPTKIERDGVSVYGRGLGGVMLDPKRDAVIRFNMERPGRHTFRCSIHPDMQGELLLLSVEAV
jgi:plastocyanin